MSDANLPAGDPQLGGKKRELEKVKAAEAELTAKRQRLEAEVKAEEKRASVVEEMADHLKMLRPALSAACGMPHHVLLQQAKMAIETADAAFLATGTMHNVRAAMRSRNTLVKILLAALKDVCAALPEGCMAPK